MASDKATSTTSDTHKAKGKKASKSKAKPKAPLNQTGKQETEQPSVKLPVAIGPEDIRLSKKALSYFQKQVELVSQEKGSCLGLRIDLVLGGCTGMNYTVTPVTKLVVGDLVGRQDTLSFFCAPEVLIHLQGLEIDLVKEGLSEKIQFNNPLAIATCGCASSFETVLGSSHLRAIRAKKASESKN